MLWRMGGMCSQEMCVIFCKYKESIHLWIESKQFSNWRSISGTAIVVSKSMPWCGCIYRWLQPNIPVTNCGSSSPLCYLYQMLLFLAVPSIQDSVLYHDISIVSILWLYDTYCIINFSYTILQTIHFCLNLGYFGH